LNAKGRFQKTETQGRERGERRRLSGKSRRLVRDRWVDFYQFGKRDFPTSRNTLGSGGNNLRRRGMQVELQGSNIALSIKKKGWNADVWWDDEYRSQS